MTGDKAFWLEVRSLLIRLVCLIEKEKLDEACTTAELRRAGKEHLTKNGK